VKVIDGVIRQFADGSEPCYICGSPLPAHEKWPGCSKPVCAKSDCYKALRAKKSGVYVSTDEIRCDGPECTNFVPEGLYRKDRRLFHCSSRCWRKRTLKGTLLIKCDCGCGEEYLGQHKKGAILRFKSREHQSRYEFEKYLTDSAGAYREIAIEYLSGFAKLQYADQSSPRKALAPFLRFLNEVGVTSLEDVHPQTVTRYLIWADEVGCRSCKTTISLISTFFKWAIATGHRRGGNPVVPMVHATRQIRRKPRPLGTDEIDLVWRILAERGSAKHRFAAALAEEAGLRISELCRVKIADINLKERRVFVVLPTKGKKERRPFFGEKTVRYYEEWMAERDPACGHEYVLYNLQLRPSKPTSLRRELNQVLLKQDGGTGANGEGFERWSLHRFRHTMATNLAAAGADVPLLLAQGGWASVEAMSAYIEVDDDRARHEYDEAMRKSSEKRRAKPLKRNLELREYLKLAGVEGN
jgi:integrase